MVITKNCRATQTQNLYVSKSQKILKNLILIAQNLLTNISATIWMRVLEGLTYLLMVIRNI